MKLKVIINMKIGDFVNRGHTRATRTYTCTYIRTHAHTHTCVHTHRTVKRTLYTSIIYRGKDLGPEDHLKLK